jgi:hypothetical protein
MMKRLLFCAAVISLAIPARSEEPGWRYLFNGKDLQGWKQMGNQEWSVRDGSIIAKAKEDDSGWLITEGEFTDFVLRLRFRWDGGDSGIQFRSRLEDGKMAGYQGNLDANRMFATGSLLELEGRQVVRDSLYDVARLVERGKWTEYEISAIGNHIEIRVNGWKTVEIDDPAGPKKGFIALQMGDPGEATIAWTDIRILEIPDQRPWQSMFNGKDLTGWHALGDAQWTVQDGAIIGRSPSDKAGYGWLVSDKEYQDFHLALRFRMPKGNSGIQFRSWQVDNMIHGYQADLASDSDWISGHLYDQNERGVYVKTDKDFTNLIDWNGWNTYEITAIGPRIQLFINGIQSIDHKDTERLRKGVFAFQVHAGILMITEWKDIRIISFD